MLHDLKRIRFLKRLLAVLCAIAMTPLTAVFAVGEAAYTVLLQPEGYYDYSFGLSYDPNSVAGNTVAIRNDSHDYYLVEYTGNSIQEISEHYYSIKDFSESGYALAEIRYDEPQNGHYFGRGIIDRSGNPIVDFGKYSYFYDDITAEGYVIADRELLNLSDGSSLQLSNGRYGGYNNGLMPFESYTEGAKWKYVNADEEIVIDIFSWIRGSWKQGH